MIRTLLRSLACLLLTAALASSLAAPVHADAGRFLAAPSTIELQAEIDSLTAASTGHPSPEQKARLEDLNQLATAIRRSDDRAQLRNASSHNIGLFLRYKKDPPEAVASLQVLAPAQDSDDDFELLGIYVPAGVTLQWGQEGQPPSGAAPASGPRVARVLTGQQLRLADAPLATAPAGVGSSQDTDVGYNLNLPIFALLEPEAAGTIAAEVPNLSQAELDAQRANAPTD